jgi:hypothetical protein
MPRVAPMPLVLIAPHAGQMDALRGRGARQEMQWRSLHASMDSTGRTKKAIRLLTGINVSRALRE